MQPTDRIEQLKQLSILRKEGTISQDEFNKLKQDLISMPPSEEKQPKATHSTPIASSSKQPAATLSNSAASAYQPTAPEEPQPEDPYDEEPYEEELQPEDPYDEEPYEEEPYVEEQPIYFNQQPQELQTACGSAPADDCIQPRVRKPFNKKALLITICTVVGIALLALVVYLLLPLHLQLGIKAKVYPFFGQKIALFNANPNNALLVYFDEEAMKYEGRIGKGTVMQLSHNNYHQYFRPYWRMGNDSIVVTYEPYGQSSRSGVDENPRIYTFHYLGDHCLIAGTKYKKDGASLKVADATIIQFKNKTTITHVDTALFRPSANDYVLISVNGRLDEIKLLNTSSSSKSFVDEWGLNMPEVDRYLKYTTRAMYYPADGRTDKVYSVCYSNGSNHCWKKEGNVFPERSFRHLAVKTVVDAVNEQLLMSSRMISDFIEEDNINKCESEKGKDYYYAIKMYVEDVYRTGNHYTVENETFLTCDTYITTSDPAFLQLSTPCWVTLKARFGSYSSGIFTPTLRMTDAFLLSKD